MQMQKMEGISYGHPGFIFAQNNLPDDGKPFGDCNYRRDSGISYGHRRFIFAQKNIHDDGAPFGNYNLRRGSMQLPTQPPFQGTIAHYIDELVPKDGSAKCLQLYFYGADNEVGNRMATFDDLDEDVIRIIMDILTVNPYAVFFRNLRELPNIDNALIVLRADPNLDQRVYNLPLVDHIAAIWEEPFSIEDYNVRDIRVYTKCQESRSIHYYYGCYDPLQYPLLFPFGEPGWHVGIKRLDPSGSIGINGNRIYCPGQHQIQANFYTSGETFLNDEHQNMERNKKKHHNVTAREYSCYLFQVRITDKTNILQTGRLAQQFIIDSYVKLETQRLDFLRDQQRQKEARVETLQGIKDSIAHEGSSSGRDIGRRVMLPASFQGGPRNLRCRYMNALALVQKYGKPDFFITMTCNPKWKEIQDQLLPFEEAQNRPDLLIRVFHAKNEVLKQELTQKQIFGDVAAYFYVIEFQKRGLPHAHWLIILERKYKLTSAEAYDTFVSAEIPDPQASQHLHNCVVQHMMHGPCRELNDKNVSESDLHSTRQLNDCQQVAFDEIIAAINTGVGGAFFIDGPGGTGKTFLYRALLASVRAREDPSFVDFLLRVGNGTEQFEYADYINLPPNMCITYADNENPLNKLISEIFPSFDSYLTDPYTVMNRAILTPTNDCVDDINDALIDNFPGQLFEYFSMDVTEDPMQQSYYQDFLNDLKAPGLPPHLLKLKQNCPVMLMRNLNAAEGLCNGTRLIVRDLGEHVIGATIACGEHKGKYVLIPKIPLQTKDNLKCPIPFKRYQFPIKLCFAITINKAQGQTLDRVGIYLPQPVFSHGQLYVALSRARTSSSVKIFIKPPTVDFHKHNQTKNMEQEEYKSLDAITTGTQGWKAKVTVLTKSPSKTAFMTGKKYQKLVLVDDLGNGVDAVIFGDEIEKYKDVLQEKKTYVITNALIKIADDRYKTPFANTGNSWIITDQTTVSNIKGPSNVTTTWKQHFIDYEEYNSLVGTTTLISTIALIVDRKPPRMTNTSSGQNTVHEYVAIDKGLKPIIVTFTRISLTSNASSIVLHDLEDPQYKKMKAWFESHEEEIKTLLQSNDISGGKFFDSSNEIIHNMTIGDVYTSDSPKRFELTVKVDLEDFSQKFIYMCCQNCHRKTTAPVDTIFHCTNCKADRVAKYRYMFKIRIKDPTGELAVTLFGEHGMNIFNMKEDQFKAKYSSESTIDPENINGRLQSQTWKMTLQKKTFEMWNGTKTISYIVQEMDGIQCTEQKLEDISPIDTQTQKTTGTKRKLSFTNVGTSPNMTTIDENDRTNKVKTVEEKGGSKIL
ncbi:hypothetical protein OROMI_007039 [Orobanche minor]